MARTPQPWFRFYVETFPDRKIRRLTPAQRWVWAAALGAAKESPVVGALYITEDVPMTVADLAAYADVKQSDTAAAVRQMVDLGMVSVDDGVISVRNFHRRQFLSDNVTDRTRAHRKRTGKERSNDVPENVPGNDAGNVPNGSDGTSSSRGGGRAGRVDRVKPPEDLTSSSGSRNAPAGFAARVVTAYVAACRDADVPAPEESQARVERSARSLLGQGFAETDLIDAARNAAVGGWTDLATQLQRDAARTSGAVNGHAKSTTTERTQATLALADSLERKAIG